MTDGKIKELMLAYMQEHAPEEDAVKVISWTEVEEYPASYCSFGTCWEGPGIWIRYADIREKEWDYLVEEPFTQFIERLTA